MTYAQITPPSAEALTLAKVKAHLRLDTSDEDELIACLIAVAREHLERSTGLCLMTQRWRLYLDSICEDGVIPIARVPVQAIVAITVYDELGQSSIVPLEGYVLDGIRQPARLMLRQRLWSGRAVNGIEIDFVAGFGPTANDVPDTLKRAMLTHVAQMFSCRGVVGIEDQPALIPPGYDRLVAPFLLRSL
ncbi:head-tail connector protein [Rhizobium tumorigenes]|uniref:Head-tail connector protein n=1 Tax=Rhizobium tumorigenes TaxID=2041385 RepID=A0AAF1K5B1_9HYPH|nr:head-tail connector protein [Rhizobium tumorigenes]WFR96232.1 head-tail connector protein [Rhizobium tumorigenes]